jgi:hypothetical protein
MGWAFFGCVAACCIHPPFLKTADTLAVLNNRHSLRHHPEGFCRKPYFTYYAGSGCCIVVVHFLFLFFL